MNWTKLFLCLSIFSVFTACASPSIINNIKLVQTVGYDVVEDEVRSAYLIANYEEKGNDKLELFSTDSETVYDSMPRLNTKLDFPIEYGQMRMVLFGDSFSRHGIKTAIDRLVREPKTSSRLHLGVADRDALDILSLKEIKEDPYFLFDMIENNIRYGNLPKMNLHVALFNYYGYGRDVFIPSFTVERGEAKIDGIALFKEDKVVTKIGMKEAFIMKALLGNSRYGNLLVPIDETDHQGRANMFIQSLGSKRNLRVIEFGPPALIAIDLQMDIQVKNNPGCWDLKSEKEIKKLEAAFNDYLMKEIQSFISLCKAHQLDPLGLTDLLRSHSRKNQIIEFQEHYESSNITVHVKSTIVQTGIGD